MKFFNSIGAVLLTLVVATGCSWFGGDEDEPEEIEPNPLVRINEEIRLAVLWSGTIGKGAEDRAIRLRPAIAGDRVYAAAAGGQVAALQSGNGRLIWRREVTDFYTKEELANAFSKDLDVITGGVGAGGDLVVVGTASGEVIALNQSDGSLAWRVPASSEVLAPPQVGGSLVVVQTIDGKVAAYDVVNGHRVWIYNTTMPALSLRGTATPVLFGDNVIAGFANGRLVILDRETGLAVLDQRVAISQGAADLERLADIDGYIELTGEGKLYVASYQGRLVAVDVNTGRLMWRQESSSVAGVGSGFGNIYLSHADSRLTAFDAESGREVWHVDALLHRDISAPVTISSYLAVTDFDGYVHLLAQSDGRFVGRRRVDGDGIQSGLVVDGGRLYALGDGGKLSVLEIR